MSEEWSLGHYSMYQFKNEQTTKQQKPTQLNN